MDTFESTILKKNRRLAQVLMASSLLNIAFLSSAIYQYFKPTQAREWAHSKGALTEDAEGVLKIFLTLGYQDLVGKLLNKTQIEPGLSRRDIALAILYSSYHVDLVRAINRPVVHFQQLVFKEGVKEKSLPVPRGLADSDFELIHRFIKQEAWPLSAKGLFLKLKFGIKEGDLFQAFYRSDSFSRIFDVLKSCGMGLKDEALLSVLLKGSDSDFEKFSLEVDSGMFNPEAFYLYYADQGSTQAALSLLDLPQFSLKGLSDAQALNILTLLNGSAEKQKEVAQLLCSSFRSDGFKQVISHMGLHTETLSAPIEPKIEMKPISMVKKPLEKEPRSTRTYVVLEGDSLWKISRKFKVDMEVLKKLNHLDSENLKPGKVLTLP